MKVKICGITRYEDAWAAVDAGADCLGFIFYPGSSRYIMPVRAGDMIARLPVKVDKVGVFVNASIAEMQEISVYCGLDIIQLHGDEPPAVAEALGWERVWKAFHITTVQDIAVAASYPAAAIVVDTATSTMRGGTGLTCDWQLAAQAAQRFPVMLAGGITPNNIVEAVESVRPLGIDVASGVEQAPGVKDHHKITELFARLEQAKRQ